MLSKVYFNNIANIKYIYICKIFDKNILIIYNLKNLKLFFIIINVNLLSFNYFNFFLNNYTYIKKKKKKLYLHNLNLLFFIFTKKIKYYGKGHRVYKKKKYKKIIFKFGCSHKCYLFFKTIIIKKLKKQSYLIKYNSNLNLTPDLIKNFKKIKFANKYTKRGLKLNRIRLKKRFGKISQAISILH